MLSFKKRAPLSSTSLLKFDKKIGAVISSMKSLSSSSRIKFSSSSSSAPPKRKNPPNKVINCSSTTKDKLIWGKNAALTSPKKEKLFTSEDTKAW